MTPAECPYCLRNAAMDAIGIPITELSVSTIYLFREQSHPGRCIVAYKDHIHEAFELPAQDRLPFMNDIAQVAAAIKKVFGPQKINYGAYGDTCPHLHFHLVPKYRDDFEWGGIFAMNPGKTILSDPEYRERIAALKAAL